MAQLKNLLGIEAFNKECRNIVWKNEEALDLHHKSEMMKEIADLRNKYELKMRVEKFKEYEEK